MTVCSGFAACVGLSLTCEILLTSAHIFVTTTLHDNDLDKHTIVPSDIAFLGLSIAASLVSFVMNMVGVKSIYRAVVHLTSRPRQLPRAAVAPSEDNTDIKNRTES